MSMFQAILELPEAASIKDKRKVVHSLRDRIVRKFRMSCAEVDLQDSLRFCQIAGALVSNSREYGEKVIGRAVELIEGCALARVQDIQVHSEEF